MSKPSTVGTTAEEVAQAEVAAAQWSRYKEKGIPVENEWIRRATGYVFDEASGTYAPDVAGGKRNADGSVVTDTSTANTANEQAYGQAMQQVNPNRLEQAEAINRDGAQQGALSSAGMALEQQAGMQQGMVNAVQRGKGMEAESLQRQSQLTAQAQQDAFSSATASADNRATNAYMAGTLGGLAGIGVAKKMGKLDSLDDKKVPYPKSGNVTGGMR